MFWVPQLPNEVQKRKMRTSLYFDRVIVKESSLAERFFEERSGDIFQTDGKESFVDVHLLRRPDDDTVGAIDSCNDEYQPKISVQTGDLPAPLGCFRDLTGSNRLEEKYDYPPRYNAEPELIPMKIKDPLELNGVLQKVGKLWRNLS